MAINAIIRFLQAARSMAQRGMKKEQILDFARREFGEVSKLLKKQIDDIFKAKPKTEKKGDVVPIKKDEGIKSTQEYKDIVEELRKSEIGNKYAGEDLEKAALDILRARNKLKGTLETKDIKKVIGEKEEVGDDFIDFVRKQGDEEGANKIQKEVDRLNKAIEDADKRVAAKEALEKRTADIKKGDVEGEGIESLETSMKNIKKATEELKKVKITPESIFEDMFKTQKVMAEGYKTGNIRTAVREFMRSEVKAGRLKLNETDSFRVREYSPRNEDDPIDVFRRHYGEDALEAVDEIGDVFSQGESFKHYEELLRQNVDKKFLNVKKIGAGDYDPNVVSAEKIRKAKEQEAKNKQLLEEFEIDPDREPNAYGGIVGNLHLNRTGYLTGGIGMGRTLAQNIAANRAQAASVGKMLEAPRERIRQGLSQLGQGITSVGTKIGQALNPSKETVLQRIQKMNPAGTGNIVQGVKDFGKHARVSEAMAGKTGQGVVPEYGMQTGYDFQTKMAGLDPKVSSALAKGYQYAQEGARSLLPGGPTWDEAMATAKKQSGQNIEGIEKAIGEGLTAEQLAARNKYLADQGQPTETITQDYADTGIESRIADAAAEPYTNQDIRDNIAKYEDQIQALIPAAKAKWIKENPGELEKAEAEGRNPLGTRAWGDFAIDMLRDKLNARPTMADVAGPATPTPDARENYAQYKARMLESLRKSHGGQKTASTDLTPTGGYSGVSREIPIEDYFNYMLADKKAHGFDPITGQALASGGRVRAASGGLINILKL